jgi:hypothetical protein
MRVRSFFFGIKAGGGGISRKPGHQTDTLLLAWFQATDNRQSRSEATFFFSDKEADSNEPLKVLLELRRLYTESVIPLEIYSLGSYFYIKE